MKFKFRFDFGSRWIWFNKYSAISGKYNCGSPIVFKKKSGVLKRECFYCDENIEKEDMFFQIEGIKVKNFHHKCFIKFIDEVKKCSKHIDEQMLKQEI